MIDCLAMFVTAAVIFVGTWITIVLITAVLLFAMIEDDDEDHCGYHYG